MAPILQELDREWDELVSSPRARRALIRWVNTTPDLAGNDNLTEVCARRRDPARCRPVMKALADLASGDEVAARTLLKMMMPGLVCLAAHVGNDDEAAIDEVISLAWERICTYPSHRGGSVAANILLDVRKRYRQHRVIEDPNSIELSEDTIDDSISVKATAATSGAVVFLSRGEADTGSRLNDWALVVCSVRDVRNRTGEVLGWCQRALIDDLLPEDAPGSRWQSVAIELERLALHPGLPRPSA